MSYDPRVVLLNHTTWLTRETPPRNKISHLYPTACLIYESIHSLQLGIYIYIYDAYITPSYLCWDYAPGLKSQFVHLKTAKKGVKSRWTSSIMLKRLKMIFLPFFNSQKEVSWKVGGGYSIAERVPTYHPLPLCMTRLWRAPSAQRHLYLTPLTLMPRVVYELGFRLSPKKPRKGSGSMASSPPLFPWPPKRTTPLINEHNKSVYIHPCGKHNTRHITVYDVRPRQQVEAAARGQAYIYSYLAKNMCCIFPWTHDIVVGTQWRHDTHNDDLKVVTIHTTSAPQTVNRLLLTSYLSVCSCSYASVYWWRQFYILSCSLQIAAFW